MENNIEVNNLSKKYDGFELKNINFAVPKGSIVGFVGENGDHIKIKIEKQNGNINVINKLGAEEITLISDSGEYEDTVYVEGMSYYLVIKTENFVGNIEIVSE